MFLTLRGIAKKLLVLLILFFHFGLFAEECEVNFSVVNCTKFDDRLDYKVHVQLSDGWKLADQVPFVKIVSCGKEIEKSKFILVENIVCIDNDLIFTVRNCIGDIKTLEVEFTIFACKDICAILVKNFVLNVSDISSVEDHKQVSLIVILFYALLGGILLNFMPCVLPILLLKIRQQNSAKNSFATVFGIYSTFTIFAFCILVLKSTGEAVGWGMHFQNSYFINSCVIFLYLLTLYAFEFIQLPISVNFSYRFGYFKDFFSGVLLTVLAIPCTAPFLGVAAAVAIQGSVFELFSIFASIALGFSVPYFVPRIMFLKISGGQWMNYIKYILNSGLIITLLWVCYIFYNHFSIIVISILVLMLIFILCSVKHKYLLTLIVILSLFIPKIETFIKQTENNNHYIDDVWKPFSPEMITQEFVANNVILVNITAKWCLTCKFNKLNILNSKRIIKNLQDNNVVCLEGDLTKANEKLLRYIHRYQRVGIPFNIVYGPNAKNGILLSEILSEKELLNAIASAR